MTARSTLETLTDEASQRIAVVPKERPILFSGPMVRAILDGKKTQTRRIAKPLLDADIDAVVWHAHEEAWRPWLVGEIGDPLLCPYGMVGDPLWVRETWYCDHAFVGDYETTRTSYIGKTLTDEECIAEWRGKPIPQDLTEEGHMMYYRADGELSEQMEQCENPHCWKPSIHMPRWASRITLEVTGIRVERLQDITEADALAEGVTIGEKMPAMINGERGEVVIFDPRKAYAVLWDAINGKRAAWETNPWVWVVSFARTTEIRGQR